MSISSINSNLAALLAQVNISNATTSTSNNVSALSSGNRIVSASTDVAALAIGSSLQSQVSTLNTVVSGLSQGSSLLQVADGGLAQIQSILQRQQAIASQAQSGSLSDTQRGFLDQEFQGLTTQIDSLAQNTNFNGVNLLNGSIQGGATATTNTASGNANKSGPITIATVGTLNSANDTLTISVGGGPTLTFTTTTDANATSGDVAGGTIVTNEAQNLVAALNNSGDASLANFRFSNNAGAIQAYYIGAATSPTSIPSITTGTSNTTNITGTGAKTFTVANTATKIGTIATAVPTANDTFTINGQVFTFKASAASATQVTIGGTVAATVTNLATALNNSNVAAIAGITFADDGAGNLYAYYSGSTAPTVTTSAAVTSASAFSNGVTNSTLAASGSVGLSVGTTSAVGNTTGNLFVTGGTSVASSTNDGQAVDLSGIYNNASFTGAFGGANIPAITADFQAGSTVANNTVTFNTTVGGITYTSGAITNTTLTGAAATAITFTGSNSNGAAGGSFTLNIQAGQSSITTLTGAQQFAAALNAGLAGVSAYQSRSVSSFNNAFTATVGGTTTATLQGASLTLNSNNFNNALVSNVSVAAPAAGSTDATISVTIGGQVYTTQAGIGNIFNTDSQIVLANTTNPAQTLTLTTGNISSAGAAGTGAAAINLSSASNAAAFQTALSNALGLNNASAGLTFQAGTTTTSTIGVSLASSTSSSLFGGQSLDVKTQSDASTAYNQLTTALNTLSSLRASVGALEERFNFATTALQNASQNEGAAKSNLLDTDVAATSTAFATSQVQLQAGIAVLAQANQLQQNLLKLL